MRDSLLLAAIVLSLAASAPADPPVPTMHANTRVVEIDVIVRDSHGKPVDGLKQSDFTVTDNGKPRPVTIFSVNRAAADPVTSAPGEQATKPTELPPLPPNIFTNVGAAAKPSEGHSTIILLDGMNGWFENFVWARQGVVGLMTKVPADEKIALYVLQNGDGLGLLQDYTTDRARLTGAISHFIPRGMHPGPPGMEGNENAIEHPAQVKASGPGGPPPPDAAKATPRERTATVQLDSEAVRLSLQALAEKLRSLPGRKSVFWVTQGFPPVQLRDMNKMAWDKTITALNDANIAVNTVDNNGWGGPPRFHGPGAIFMMQQIAEETGGQAYFHRNDLDAAMASGIADSRMSYTLAFYLTEMDGQYHSLRVYVDRPGLDLNYRQGYYAQTEAIRISLARKSDINSALLNPSGVNEIGITAKLDLAPGKLRAILTAHLKLDPQSLSIRQSPGGWTGKIEELFVELNAVGREVGRVSDTKKFEISAAQKSKYDSQGVVLAQPIQLAPGAVTLSVVVRDTASGRTGTLIIPLDRIVRGDQ
jgi:VWFA-related protein